MGRTLMQTLALSVLQMRNRAHEFMVLEHILLAMTYERNGRRILTACNVDIPTLRRELETYLNESVPKTQGADQGDVYQSPAVTRVIERALNHVQNAGKLHAEIGDLLASMLEEDEDCWAVYFLKKQNVSRLQLLEYISHEQPQSQGPADRIIISDIASITDPEDAKELEESLRASMQQEEDEESNDNALARFTVDLVAKAKKGRIDPLIGRENELTRTLEVLLRRRKNNPLFVGEPGTGKTAIAEGLALAIANKQVPPQFLESSIYSLDMGALLAGARYRGDFENRIKSVVKELGELPNSILVIDEIHTIVGAGSTSGGSLDAANLLKPILATGELRCIGSTTHEEFRNHFEKDRALTRRFQRIDIREPSQEDSLAILYGLQTHYEDFHEVRYAKGTFESAIELSVRFLQDRLLPDKAIDILDEAAASVRLHEKKLPKANSKKTKRQRPYVTLPIIEKVVARMANIPVSGVAKNEQSRLKSLKTDLQQSIFGQDAAIHAVTHAIWRSKAGLGKENRPQASFLFHGPTGVGKTELAKCLADLLHVPFLRFDMSEYMEKHAVARLIGSPPGYVGYEQGGLLTEAVRKTPHAVLLLDEMEKAHPDIYNVLLQVMDYATLTDNNGKKADFRHIVIIMTSNAGAWEMQKSPMGFIDKEHASTRSTKAVENAFSPEFRNRLDAMIGFESLNKEHMLPIVHKVTKELFQGLDKHKVQLTMDNSALNWLAEKGFDPKLGARPLQRLVRTELEDLLAQEVLFGKLAKGGEVKIIAPNTSAEHLQCVFPKSHTPKDTKAKNVRTKQLKESIPS